MTNNPTIDGVSRRMLTALLCHVSALENRALVGELRSLLDAPAVEPNNELREHCKQCAEVVKTWPEWKRDCLGGAPEVEQQEPVEYPEGVAELLERSDWTPAEALAFYAKGKHFTISNGRTAIIDTGAVASNALKHASIEYLEMKGDAALSEARSIIDRLEARITQLESEAMYAAAGYQAARDRIAELESGRGEPVGRVSYIGSGFVRVRTTECLAIEQPLFTAPPAPVAVADENLAYACELLHAWKCLYEDMRWNDASAFSSTEELLGRLDATAALTGVKP